MTATGRGSMRRSPGRPARRASPRTRVDSEQGRAQILDAFSARAKRMGIRAVLMGELASELRMSASTLYKLFPSKEALAMACVERWVDELAASEATRRDPAQPRRGFDRFMHWLDAWADALATLSPAFIRDLQSDYPAAWQRFRAIALERSARGTALLRPLLKPELDQGVALAVLDLIVNAVQRPEFAERLGVTRRQAVHSAVSIWASGALDRQGELHPLRSGKDA